jgi:hypothetical protein
MHANARPWVPRAMVAIDPRADTDPFLPMEAEPERDDERWQGTGLVIGGAVILFEALALLTLLFVHLAR